MTSRNARRSSKLLQRWQGFIRSAARTLLMVSSCGVIIGLPARAQSPNAKVFQCTRDRNRREEIDRAVRDRIATLYPNCPQAFESGRVFDIQMQEIRIQDNSAIVSYVLVLFENCEEGAPVSEASRYKEHWIRRATRWELEGTARRLAP